MLNPRKHESANHPHGPYANGSRSASFRIQWSCLQSQHVNIKWQTEDSSRLERLEMRLSASLGGEIMWEVAYSTAEISNGSYVDSSQHGIVECCAPYGWDPEVETPTPNDSSVYVRHSLRVWHHCRVYRAAKFACEHPHCRIARLLPVQLHPHWCFSYLELALGFPQM